MGLLATRTKQQNMASPMWLAMLLFLFIGTTEGQLNVLEEKKCGEFICKPQEYCSDIDHRCSDCKEICDSRKAHMFEERLCEKNCQDFLHDQRYARISGNSAASADDKDLRGKVQRLEVIATVALIISLILAIILLGLITIWIRKKNILPSLFKKNKTEKGRYPGDTPISTIRLPNKSTTVTIPAISDAVRNNNPGPPPTDYSTNLTTFRNPAPKKTAPTTPQASATVKPKPQLERRVPSEDSALDFAYDNPAMTPSPVLNKGEVTP